MPTPRTATERTTIRRHAERAVPEEAARIMAAGLVAHVGLADPDGPVVMPMTYHYDPATPDRVYLHGAHQSRLLRHLATGAPVCVTVTILDELVYSKTAMYHSVNYRSVVCFARAVPAPDRQTQQTLLERMIARYHPGRTAGRDYAPTPDEHVRATSFVALRIDEWSAKSRSGGPKGPGDLDPAIPGTAGVRPLGP
jgi:nitroimidazol reductase NimA-like FMN-containing flavoprotein (pyridoxamine 5'-phosphate oxidase superfamily)